MSTRAREFSDAPLQLRSTHTIEAMIYVAHSRDIAFRSEFRRSLKEHQNTKRLFQHYSLNLTLIQFMLLGLQSNMLTVYQFLH